MSSNRNHLSKENVVIVFSSHLITNSIIGLIDLHEFFVSLFIALICLRVIFEGQFPVGILNFIKVCLSAHSQNFVCIVERIREVLIEELFLCFIHDSFLIEEPVEGGVSIFKGILLHE